jgi:hypothetical protein
MISQGHPPRLDVEVCAAARRPRSRYPPDEYFLIDSANPKVAGLDGAVRSFVDLFYTLA